MTMHEQDQNGDDGLHTTPRKLAPAQRPRFTFALGVAGLASVLGVGSYLTAGWLMNDNDTVSHDVSAISPVPTSAPQEPPRAGTAVPARTGAGEAVQPEASPPATPTGNKREQVRTTAPTRSKSVQERIDEARAKAKADGVPLKRPLIAKTAAGQVSERTETLDNGTVRITTARHDLTGHRQLLLAGDAGDAAGPDIRCTSKIRFSEGAPATARPSLLLCWRISAARSVVTMMATPGGTPSVAANIDLIEREWLKLAD